VLLDVLEVFQRLLGRGLNGFGRSCPKYIHTYIYIYILLGTSWMSEKCFSICLKFLSALRESSVLNRACGNTTPDYVYKYIVYIYIYIAGHLLDIRKVLLDVLEVFERAAVVAGTHGGGSALEFVPHALHV